MQFCIETHSIYTQIQDFTFIYQSAILGKKMQVLQCIFFAPKNKGQNLILLN